MTYNVIQQASNSNRTPSILDDHKYNLDSAIGLWSKQYREYETHNEYNYEKLAYILEHDYSEANICLDHLKGQDQRRIRYISDSCRDQGFCLFLAHFQCSQSGSIDEDERHP